MVMSEEIKKIDIEGLQISSLKDNSIVIDTSKEAFHEILSKLYSQGLTHLSAIIGYQREDNLVINYPISAPIQNADTTTFVQVVVPASDTPIIDTVTDLYPGSKVYEQELTELLGFRFERGEHYDKLLLPDSFPDDLYPLRKEVTSEDIKKILDDLGVGSEKLKPLPKAVDDDYSLSIGPQHPTHKEPIRFQFYVDGETIKDVKLRIGFNHRGIEKGLEENTWKQNLYLIERICGICSAAHQLAYTVTAEKIAGIVDEIPDRAQYLRVLISELERIHSHILWYGVLAHDGGYDFMFHITWRDREIVMDILERLTGNRVNYSIETIGGIRKDIDEDTRIKVLAQLKKLRTKVVMHYDILEKEKSFLQRINRVGTLSYDRAIKMNAVGPTARASGINFDLRRDFPYVAYKEVPVKVFTRKEGDVYASLMVRLDETVDSIDQCIYVLENLPAGDIAIKVRTRLPKGEAHTRVEAPRGEDIHFIRSTGGKGPDRHKIRAPTLANITSLMERFRDMEVADIPMIIRLIDPCIGCMERVTFTNINTNKSIDMSGEELIAKANKKFRLNTSLRLFKV